MLNLVTHVLSAVGMILHILSIVAFVRLERFDLNATIPANGVKDPTLNQTHVIGGLTYLPHPNVVVKADIRLPKPVTKIRLSLEDSRPLL